MQRCCGRAAHFQWSSACGIWGQAPGHASRIFGETTSNRLVPKVARHAAIACAEPRSADPICVARGAGTSCCQALEIARAPAMLTPLSLAQSGAGSASHSLKPRATIIAPNGWRIGAAFATDCDKDGWALESGISAAPNHLIHSSSTAHLHLISRCSVWSARASPTDLVRPNEANRDKQDGVGVACSMQHAACSM